MPPPAPQDLRAIAALYDAAAPRYDAVYGGRREAIEDAALSALLRFAGIRRASSVADLGCGSGYLPSLLRLEPRTYTGVDLSGGMLALARNRHPTLPFVQAEMTTYLRECLAGRFDFLCSLWCAANYVRPRALARALAQASMPGGKVFIMAMVNGFHPRVDVAGAVPLHSYEHAGYELRHAGFCNVHAAPFAWTWEDVFLPVPILAAGQVAGAMLRRAAACTENRYVIWTGERL